MRCSNLVTSLRAVCLRAFGSLRDLCFKTFAVVYAFFICAIPMRATSEDGASDRWIISTNSEEPVAVLGDMLLGSGEDVIVADFSVEEWRDSFIESCLEKVVANKAVIVSCKNGFCKFLWTDICSIYLKIHSSERASWLGSEECVWIGWVAYHSREADFFVMFSAPFVVRLDLKRVAARNFYKFKICG